jgi:hypothetical protein
MPLPRRTFTDAENAESFRSCSYSPHPGSPTDQKLTNFSPSIRGSKPMVRSGAEYRNPERARSSDQLASARA